MYNNNIIKFTKATRIDKKITNALLFWIKYLTIYEHECIRIWINRSETYQPIISNIHLSFIEFF